MFSDSESTQSSIAVIAPKTIKRQKPRRQPRYHIVLWNDDHHTYEYVVEMLRSLFGYPSTKGLHLASQVDHAGRAVLLTTTREHAELKRDQVHAYGYDSRVKRCKGSMSASIEPAE